MPEFNPGDYVTTAPTSYARVETVHPDHYTLRRVLVLHPDQITVLATDTLDVPRTHPLSLVLSAQDVQRPATVLGQLDARPAPPPFAPTPRVLN